MSKKNRKVYIIGGGQSGYTAMFRNAGWLETETIFDADLVQFTGGADITPSLYGHQKHSKTNNNLLRDKREAFIFNVCLKKQIPMTGICRGGQFLNVMCGGFMWQHVDRHTNPHKAFDTLSGNFLKVSSTHHQVMGTSRLSKHKLLLFSLKQSTWKEKCRTLNPGIFTGSFRVYGSEMDIEALMYEQHKVLCFQPHPEFENFKTLRKLYFKYIDNLLSL